MSRNLHTHQFLILLATLGQSRQIRNVHWKKVQQVCITLPPAALPRQQMSLTDFSLQKLKNQTPFLARDTFTFNSAQKGFQTALKSSWQFTTEKWHLLPSDTKDIFLILTVCPVVYPWDYVTSFGKHPRALGTMEFKPWRILLQRQLFCFNW